MWLIPKVHTSLNINVALDVGFCGGCGEGSYSRCTAPGITTTGIYSVGSPPELGVLNEIRRLVVVDSHLRQGNAYVASIGRAGLLVLAGPAGLR